MRSLAASGPDKTAAICYALGWTQHSKGVQIIRTASILQLLLGNIGRPGGGIHGAARSRFHSRLDRHPDALRYFARLSPDAARRRHAKRRLRDYLAHQTKPTGLWHNFPSLLHQLAEGVLRQERDGGKRLRLRAGSRRSPGTIRSSNISTTWPTGKWKACS